MKFQTPKASFLQGLQMVQNVVGIRTTIPVLSHVCVRAEEKKIWLTATDLELSVRCAVDADVSEAGASALPARRLLSIIRELPEENVAVEVDEKNTASIECGPSFFRIIGLSEEEFPPIAPIEGGHIYTMEQGAFAEMLRKTSYAASTDETCYVLNGVLLSFKDGKLAMVATDGRRLALVEHEVEFPKDAERDLILPSKAVNELLHVLKDEGSMRLRATEKQVACEFEDVLVVSKLIDATYPNFRQVIPSQCEERIAVEREALLLALRRVSLLTIDKSSSVRMKFGRNRVEVTANTPDVGEAREIVPVKHTGKEVTLAFNPEYAMDPLRNLTSDEVYLEITDELSPGVVKCDIPFLYVLMPMRVT